MRVLAVVLTTLLLAVALSYPAAHGAHLLHEAPVDELRAIEFDAVGSTAVPPLTAPGARLENDVGPSSRDTLLNQQRAHRAEVATRPSRGSTRTREVIMRPVPSWLRACATHTNDPARMHSNGEVPTAALCRLPTFSAHLLHADAAGAWWRLNKAYSRRFGATLCLTDSYRSYQFQAALYGQKPGLAAVPGTSNHGWGVAVDLCGGIESGTSTQYRWLAQNGSRYGWINPAWARPGGSRPEPWHWEFVDHNRSP